MKRHFFHLALSALTGAMLISATAASAAPKKVLVVTVTKGFRHSSITNSVEKVINAIAAKDKSFTADYAWNDADLAAKMTPAALKGYDTIIFANTTGVLPLPDKNAFLDFVKSGKGFVGIHSASDTFHGKEGEIDPYIEMLGGEFLTHKAQAAVDCINEDRKHPATSALPDVWSIKQEEIYLMKNYHRENVHNLLSLDKHPNEKTPGHFPISWCKQYGKGRVFYTSLGHREDVWESQPYQAHLLGGIRWALGLDKGDAKPQTKAGTGK
jgi:type 1 glutamine amidotransferase